MPKGIPKNTLPSCANPKYYKRGHPPFPIDWTKVDNFLIAGASGIQIAAVLGCHQETLYEACKREKHMLFSDYSICKYEKGNAMLLGVQYDMAIKRDRTMAVWLGKNRLGQTDKIDSKIESTNTQLQKKILQLPDNGRRNLE